MATRFAAVLALLPPVCSGRGLETLEQLMGALQSGPNRKVGFLSTASADAVRTVLPTSVERVVCSTGYDNGVINCTSIGDMVRLVKDGTLAAGLIPSLPPPDQADDLHHFSSTMVSTRAMLMAPPNSVETPHGPTDSSLSSFDLSKAVDAAIVSMQAAGRDEEVRLKNMPFEFVAVHTCKGPDLSAFSVPNMSSATGLLRKTLDSRVLKVGALGPRSWGGQVGDYTVSPPVGFYPDWLTEFCASFNALSGRDGVKYNSGGSIACERTYNATSAAVFKELLDGNSYLTEPYYVVDGFYYGTGEACTSSSDCRSAALAGGHESCDAGKCAHPASPRTRHFRLSCSTVGVDDTFITKAEDDFDNTTLIAVLVMLSSVLVAAACCICILMRSKNRRQTLYPGETPGGKRRSQTGQTLFSGETPSVKRRSQTGQTLFSGETPGGEPALVGNGVA